MDTHTTHIRHTTHRYRPHTPHTHATHQHAVTQHMTQQHSFACHTYGTAHTCHARDTPQRTHATHVTHADTHHTETRMEGVGLKELAVLCFKTSTSGVEGKARSGLLLHQAPKTRPGLWFSKDIPQPRRTRRPGQPLSNGRERREPRAARAAAQAESPLPTVSKAQGARAHPPRSALSPPRPSRDTGLGPAPRRRPYGVRTLRSALRPAPQARDPEPRPAPPRLCSARRVARHRREGRPRGAGRGGSAVEGPAARCPLPAVPTLPFLSLSCSLLLRRTPWVSVM